MAEKHHPEIEEKVAASSWLAALTGQSSVSPVTKKTRCYIDSMIDEMIAEGNSEQEILTMIIAQYRPYDILPAFDEGFKAYQTSGALRCRPYDNAPADENPVAACKRQVKSQAYDRGANAAMWLGRAQQRMKPAAK
jgi:hypothetical protein